jgi:hypothetical protein
MRELIEKIEELRKGLAAMKPKENPLVPALNLPSLKPLTISASSVSAAKPKLPGVPPVTGKDPKKMAEQLKNPRPKAPKIEVLKADEEPHYRIHVDGNPVTDPMPLSHITAKHGPVQRIESMPGHRVVPVKAPGVPAVAKNGQWSLDKFGEGNSV